MGNPQADLLTAVGSDDLAGIKSALAAGADLDARCDDGASVLYLACMRGEADVVSLLLDLGSDPNLRAEDPAAVTYDATPLDLVIGAQFLLDWEKYSPIYTLLVSRGARDSDGEVPDAFGHERQRRALRWQEDGIASTGPPRWLRRVTGSLRKRSVT